MSAEIEKIKTELILKHLNSKEELRDWMYTFFGLKFPMGVVYPTSTHGPIDAAWRIYELMKTGQSQDVPEVVLLSSRDSFKTLIASAIEVLCLIHFEISIAHAAAILSQSEKAVTYANSFFAKISPYLVANGWEKTSDNKTKIEWKTDKGETIYLRVLVMTRKGMNSEHLPMLFIDEIDLIQDPGALEEAKMVPSIYKHYFPLTVALSTRKYAGGLMEKRIKETERSGGEILRWNIIDITERITPEEAKVNEPKVIRYLARELPLRNVSEQQFLELNEKEQQDYERFEAYAGIAEHPLLPVMRHNLVHRPQDDTGHLYRPLIAVRNNFRTLSPEMGEAQLLCNKPSSSGLVYPRFDRGSNSISIDEAYSFLSGEPEKDRTADELIKYMHNLGIEFYGSADWGNTDETSLGVYARITGGVTWMIDLVSAPDMEIPEIKDKCKVLTEIYRIKKWFCDSAYPAYIKMLRQTKTSLGYNIPAIGVAKGIDSVVDGITCVQSKIVDTNNIRFFKILKTKNTERVFDSFETYKWKLDGKGDPIDGKPQHGKDGVADIMDTIRYYFHSMFGKGSKVLFSYELEVPGQKHANLQSKINDLTGNKPANPQKSGKKKGIVWNI